MSHINFYTKPLGQRSAGKPHAALDVAGLESQIADLLADAMGAARRDVKLATGPASPLKTFIIKGMTARQIRRCLLAL